MADLNELFSDLRKEIQTDRIELQRTITQGFDRMNEKFDEHAKQDTENFSKLDDRLSSVEYDQKLIKRAGGATLGALMAAVATYFTNFFQ